MAKVPCWRDWPSWDPLWHYSELGDRKGSNAEDSVEPGSCLALCFCSQLMGFKPAGFLARFNAPKFPGCSVFDLSVVADPLICLKKQQDSDCFFHHFQQHCRWDSSHCHLDGSGCSHCYYCFLSSLKMTLLGKKTFLIIIFNYNKIRSRTTTQIIIIRQIGTLQYI